MTPKRSTISSRVAEAIGLYRSVVACEECIARGNDVHAFTAALMLPCYQAEFRMRAQALTPAEAGELRHALDAFGDVCR